MAQSSGFRGRIPSTTGLPRVSKGMGISPAHINDVSAGVDRVTLRKGSGYTFKQTSGGTALNITDNAKQHPWKCVNDGVNIFINIGRIWGNGIMEHPNNTLLTGAGYPEDTVYFGGRTLFVDVDNATCISSDSVSDNKEEGFSCLAVPAKQGYYYIQYVLWESNDTLMDDPASDKALNSKQFVLKYLPLSGTLPKTNIYPVCELQDDGLLVQGITSDIYYAPQIQTHPYQIYITDFDGDAYAEVAMGTLCNLETEYEDGIPLGDPDGGVNLGRTGSLSGADIYFFVKAEVGTSNGNPVFPSRSVGVILKSGSSIPKSGSKIAYVGIGKVSFKDNEAKVEQFVTGSLWGEYFKLGSKPAEFWFSRI